MIERLTEWPRALASTVFTTVFVVGGFVWSQAGQLFYAASLFASSVPILPITQEQAGIAVGVTALLALLKFGTRATDQVEDELDQET